MSDTGRYALFAHHRVCVQIIEEYARHLGHADLLREAVDGVTGY